MERKIFIMLLFFALLAPVASYADIPQVQHYIGEASKKGAGRLKYLVWDVYDATLYSSYSSNESFNINKPFALKLDYLIALKGNDIAERSIKEMRGQGFEDEEKLERWQAQMKNIFPDVESGESIIGIRDIKGNSIFYKNTTKIGQVNDPEFTKVFFDIWLGQDTSHPYLRQQLLGLK